MRKMLGVGLLLAIMSFAVCAYGDTIVLTDGTKIEGEILEEADWGVKIKTKFGPIDIARRGISRIIKAGESSGEYAEKAKELAKEHVELAKWCAEKGMAEEAKKHYKMALEFDPGNEQAKSGLKAPVAEPKKEPEKAEPAKEPVKEPEKKAEGETLTQEEMMNLHREAMQKLQAKEYDAAEKLYLKIVKANPKDNNALYNLACLYSLTKKIDKALEYFEKSIKAGFTNVRHIQQDGDLDNIRNEEKYKELVKELMKKDKGNMLEWESDYDTACRKAEEQGKNMLVYFTKNER